MTNIPNEQKNRRSYFGRLRSLWSWYNRTTIAKQLSLPGIIAAFAGVALALFTRGNDCTCAEQIPETAMYSIARAGNKEVARYLERKESVVLCAAMRAEILEKIKSNKGISN